MAIKQHLGFNIPDDVDRKIWRYISIDKLQLLLKDKALYFRRSDLFEDQHEGSYTAQAKEYRKKFYGPEAIGWTEHTMPKINFNLKQCTYISCWHVNENENMHMWQSYAEKHKTIAITSSISKLKNYILDNDSTFLLGPIHYLDYENDLVSEGNAFAPFFCKRREFSGEREFRIIKERMIDIDGVMNNTIEMPTGINIPIDLENLIDNIYTSPYSDDTFKNRVIKLLKKHKLEEKIGKSSLTTDPIY